MTEQAEPKETQNPLTNPKFIFSAVIVAIIVALGLVFALTPRGGGSISPTAPINNSPTTNSQASTSLSSSVCGLPPGNQNKPAAPPADTQWELIEKFAVPTSPKQYGPGQSTAGGLRSCFAHSPTGALYAGTNLIILGSSGRGDLLAQHLVVAGPERDKMLNLATSPPASVGPGAAPFQLAGYKIVDYSDDQAVIEYGITTSNGSQGSVSVAMRWEGGDWKWVLPATGQPEARQLNDLNGFIPWAGV